MYASLKNRIVHIFNVYNVCDSLAQCVCGGDLYFSKYSEKGDGFHEKRDVGANPIRD